MTEDSMPGDGPSAMVTGSVMGSGEVTGLVNLFVGMLGSMEQRLVAKMDENAKAGAERWSDHKIAHADRDRELDDRFLRLEHDVSEHHRIAHEEQIRVEARVRPVKNLAGWVWFHWRDIILLAIGMLALFAAVGEWFGRLVGPHP